MRVVSVPGRLRLATFLLILAVPLAAAEVLLVTRAPWWKLPYRTIELWSAAVALIVLPLIAWISAGKKWAYFFMCGFGVAWCLLTAFNAIRLRSPALGFYTALMIAYWGALASWIRVELGRSFFDPRMRWYMGRPRALPGLLCELGSGESATTLRVGRMDERGAFVFAPPGGIFRLRPGSEAEMMFKYRDSRIRCRGVPVRAWDARGGAAIAAGYQFRGMSADARKELGDFVEQLRGEGHV